MSNLTIISKENPPLESMHFDKLREKGLQRIQELSKNTWTDYNLHDPGVTTLEALCYAITDLGYRLTFDMQDLLANNPNAEADIDFKNFFTARQILHNGPVTIKDFRKLLMDVAVQVGGETIGIKNAWVTPSVESEMKLYVDKVKEKLDYFPTSTDPNGFFLKGLYNFLFEFDQSINHGDLNSNSLSGTYIINDFVDPLLDGVEVEITIHFPRWDDSGVDFENDASITSKIKSIKVEFDEMPTGYLLWDSNDLDATVTLKGIKTIASVPVDIPDLNLLDDNINNFIFVATDGILQRYKTKIAIVKSILKKAEDRLNDNRPLCEDYFNTRALKVEQIAICGDVEIDPFADAATVAAKIYFEISRFLSPDVLFYSLPDIKAKGKSTEDIFDGPALEHGFIDDDELNASTQKCTIRVSDLIQIMMDIEVEGKKVVRSVSGLQLANYPEDNDETIAQKSVKWCMSLAIDQLYVPRLSPELSNLSFYKNNLPFSFDKDDMDMRYKELFSNSRKRYPENPILDRPLPAGKWRETTDYTSIQEDFPLVYGVGSDGIPNLPIDNDARNERITDAKQFKGFLSFFDQMLYGYLQQVNGLKSLFSLNQELDQYGQPLLNKTYFGEPLTSATLDVVPNANSQEIFADNYSNQLQAITETKDDFEKRKNRFLDHLLSRFCEQFSDYALIAYTIDGQKAGAELIKDKLAFLNSYPEISSNRGKAFNYKNELSWFYKNVSGYEKRVSMLLGIDPKKPEDLFFSHQFRVLKTGTVWSIETKSGGKVYFQGNNPFKNELLAKSGMEKMISAGVHQNNYKIISGSALNKYQIVLFDDLVSENIIAQSKNTALTLIGAKTLISDHIILVNNELYNNNLANRKNLAPPILAYFEVLTHTVVKTTVPYLHKIKYQLFDQPKDALVRKIILKGDIEGPEVTGLDDAETLMNTEISLLWKLIRFASDVDYYRFDPEHVINYEPNYRFEVFDIYGNTIGKHQSKNYNGPLAEIIEDSAYTPQLKIVDSLSNNGTYTVNNTVATGPNIKIEINETLPNNYPDGKVKFTETFTAEVSDNGRELSFDGLDLTSRMRVGDKMTLIKSPVILIEFEILKISYTDNKTTIISSIVLDHIVNAKILYDNLFSIKSITPKTITIRAVKEKLAVQDMVSFFNKTFIDREGIHLIEHLLLRPKKNNSDKLLNIHNDVDCEQCKITDTYSFVMTAVLPYWPDRFRDRNFRNFIEKTLREESPAHVAMNICWVSPLQMGQFEKAYKNWLIQINTTSSGDVERVQALKNFIEIIQGLRSVYPSGKLHSCNENEVQKNTLILNQTNIGIF
ncbi:hypothetical protein EZ449_08605 [Pedobacter frigidisoli]|uniref:Uncharacterized protein n=1 Tax=Pedobacter frigidisoli TaxID=2530455 RepID=A0A4R0P3Y2_9SPHI|nr:hypothetical protein [Pedobacter frigidisoli]TCD10402.1 hypothetical protein EZ449_08605 [Pedobacter frigidisoli]